MGLDNRDYMRSPRPTVAKLTRIDARAYEAGFRATADRRAKARRRLAMIAWTVAGTGAVTAAWAIGCGMIGAQWQGSGKTFEPRRLQAAAPGGEVSHGPR